MGFGVVVQDEEGRMVAALSIMHVRFLDPPMAEAWVALKAIKMCKVMHFSNLHFEGDAQIVIKAVHSLEVDWSRMGLLVDDIKGELEGQSQWRMIFVR